MFFRSKMFVDTATDNTRFYVCTKTFTTIDSNIDALDGKRTMHVSGKHVITQHQGFLYYLLIKNPCSALNI